ncbi:MAG TPA: hypothetical protein DEA08_17325, partial [Planctomycetes bacterium]|nr:hypothetical protein [Planctomycetota bacterium]
YEVERELGRGGMGAVYLARDPRLGREVAVKVLTQATRARSRERFAREAEALARLDHPHVVKIHHQGTERGQPYLVLDYVAGESLAERLKRGPLPAREAVELMVRLTRGVAHAHQQGILHRDIKPENVLVARGEPLLTDFGLAHVGESHLTQTGQILGTPAFMAPEQANGERVDARADVYALGATLYALLSGRPPFRGETLLKVLSAVLDKAPARLSEVEEVDAELEALVLRCLAKEPAERPASAEDLAFDLEAWLRADAARGEARGGSRLPFALGALAVVALAAGLALAVSREPRSSAAPSPDSSAAASPTEREAPPAPPAPTSTPGAPAPLGQAQQALFDQAEAAFLSGDDSEVLKLLARAEHPRLRCLRAWSLLDLGQQGEAERLAEEVARAWSGYGPLRLLQIVLRCARGPLTDFQLRELLDDARGAGDVSEVELLRTYAWCGRLLRSHGVLLPELEERLRELLAQQPGDLRCAAYLINLRAPREGWHTLEAEALALHERSNKRCVLVWQVLANSRRFAPSADKVRQGLQTWLTGAKACDDDPVLLLNAGIMFAARSYDVPRALALLRQVRARAERDGLDSLQIRAGGAYLGHKLTEAIDAYLNPRPNLRLPARHPQAELKAWRRETQELSASFAEGVTEDFPGSLKAHDMTGFLLQDAQRYEEAYAYTRKTVQRWPGEPSVQYQHYLSAFYLARQAHLAGERARANELQREAKRFLDKYNALKQAERE